MDEELTEQLEESVEADASEQPADEDALAAAEAEAAAARLSTAVDHVRVESRAARIFPRQHLLEEPFAYTDEQVDELLAALSTDESCADIVCTLDERTGAQYLHSTTFLSVPYARLLLRSQANDPAFMIAQTVRENAEIYPRPTSVEYFEFEPFSLELAEVFAHLTVMESLEEYADIRRVTVSNGMVYLYSDRFMTEPQAQGSAQWEEVDSHLNSNQ